MIPKDAGKTTAVVYIDLSKAFDKVRHQPLLLKLHSVGVCGSALMWFANYLQCRLQRVITSSGSSSFVLINRGVPQGSVLGPLLFNIYVSHLPDITIANASTLLLFADKTLYSAHESIAAAAQVTTDAISAFSESLDALGLCFNSSKTS